ncbi:hypothetical protein GOV03_03870 [Candidatus Woesearchaeota archaeon]|nr:hypothetical protein [Candidatus Woesearchaeota archaeon]
MTVKQTLSKILIGAGFLTCLAGCDSEPRIEPKIESLIEIKPKKSIVLEVPVSKLELAKETFDFDHVKITQYANYGSDNIVVVLMDHHYPHVTHGASEKAVRKLKKTARKVQRELYSTLKELANENELNFVGLEGYIGEFSMNNLHQVPKERIFVYKEILESEPQYLEKIIDTFCFEKGLCSAGRAFELNKGPEVFTYGMEDEKILAEGTRIFLDYLAAVKKVGEYNRRLKSDEWQKLSELEKDKIHTGVWESYQKAKKKFHKITVEKRSRVFVDNLLRQYQEWEKETNSSKLIVLIAGHLHTESIATRLDEVKQTYVIVKPNGLELNYKKHSKTPENNQ